MTQAPALWATPVHHLKRQAPETPILYVAPAMLQAQARRFLDGFPGEVTFAVKANPAREVLENLVAAGLEAFDVASPAEMAAVRSVMPTARLHYHNPVRSVAEIEAGLAYGCLSWSVDDAGELEKLIARLPRWAEIAVRFKLSVEGAAYDFGSKFGAEPDAAVKLLARVAEAGFVPSMTFHPGTQCPDGAAWEAYIVEAAKIARAAGVTLHRLNVGGGFPSHRLSGVAPDLDGIFNKIRAAVATQFDNAPRLVCEPGRAMVAEAFTLAAEVKSVRANGTVFLSDGIYGALAEAPLLGAVTRLRVIARGGGARLDRSTNRVVFGPTCDSLDRLPEPAALPADLAEGDVILFDGMGAYSTATVTGFNGYGAIRTITVDRLI